jgi:hypothetical protein
MNIKRVLGGWLGYEQELNSLRRKVQEYSWDDPFGMWTRKAFLDFCGQQPARRRLVCFLDLVEIGHLNLKWGYSEVDRRIKAAFSSLSPGDDFVARWYSGDEIVILFSPGRPIGPKIRRLEESARASELFFHMEISFWDAGQEPVVEVINRLSEKTAFYKWLNHREEIGYEIERNSERFADWAVHPEKLA